MSGMDLMNKVMLAGRLTRDPELRETASGKKVADLSLALDQPARSQGDRNQTRGAPSQSGSGSRPGPESASWAEDDPIYVEVTYWERTAENAVEYLRKGSAVLVEGRLKMDRWEDRETGKTRRKLKVAGERLKFLNLAPARQVTDHVEDDRRRSAPGQHRGAARHQRS